MAVKLVWRCAALVKSKGGKQIYHVHGKATTKRMFGLDLPLCQPHGGHEFLRISLPSLSTISDLPLSGKPNVTKRGIVSKTQGESSTPCRNVPRARSSLRPPFLNSRKNDVTQ